MGMKHHLGSLRHVNDVVLLIAFLSFLSLGAWWDWGKNQSKKDGEKKESPKVEVIKVESKEGEKEGALEKRAEKQGSIQEAATMVIDSEDHRKEIEEIQQELSEIIARTRELQEQVKDNRAEIQSILERAQIHERILRDMTLPPPVQLRHQINPDEILKQEKLRLISEQARRTQEELQVIQQTRSLRALQSVPTDAKASKST